LARAAIQCGNVAASALPDGREVALHADDDVAGAAGLDPRFGSDADMHSRRVASPLGPCLKEAA
jgi:hypothetical protein